MFCIIVSFIVVVTLTDSSQCNTIPSEDRVKLNPADAEQHILEDLQTIEQAVDDSISSSIPLQEWVNTQMKDENHDGAFLEYVGEYNRDDDQKTMPPMKYETVTECRRECLSEYLVDSKRTFDGCEKHGNCLMCWDYCAFLHGRKRNTFKAMCEDPTCVSIRHEFVYIRLGRNVAIVLCMAEMLATAHSSLLHSMHNAYCMNEQNTLSCGDIFSQPFNVNDGKIL